MGENLLYAGKEKSLRPRRFRREQRLFFLEKKQVKKTEKSTGEPRGGAHRCLLFAKPPGCRL
jgi:hypothetical protein